MEQYSLAELANYSLTLQKAAEKIHSIGANKKVIFQYCPGPMRVYPENIPESFNQYKGENRTDGVVNYLREHLRNAYVTYALDDLRENKKKYENYYKSDTHANIMGSYIMWQAIQKICDIKQTPVEELKPKQVSVKNRRAYGNNLTAVIGEPLGRFDPIDWQFDYKSEVKVKSGENIVNYSPFSTVPEDFNKQYIHTSNATSQKSILMIGDSYLAPQNYFSAKDFSRVDMCLLNQVPNTFQTYELNVIKQKIIDADVIVIEGAHSIASRHNDIMAVCKRITEALS